VQDKAAGRSLLRLDVGKPDRDWYFLKRGKDRAFLVRLGNESRELKGEDMVAWQRARPRG
jgi:hypothetical protein